MIKNTPECVAAWLTATLEIRPHGHPDHAIYLAFATDERMEDLWREIGQWPWPALIGLIEYASYFAQEKIIEELDKIQVYRKTVSNVLGIGQPQTEVYRGLSETGNLVKKVRFEIAVNDAMVEPVISAITKETQNEENDGKIFVIALEDCIQIGTGIRGPNAVGQ